MSTHPEFVQYLLDQLEGLGELRARKMFGDYLVYLNDRPALLVCDGTPFAKPLPCVAELLKDRPTAPPYEGAKAHYVLDPEDRDTLRRAAELVSQNSPPPKKTEAEGMTKPTDRRKFRYLPEAENDLIIIGGSDGPAYPVDAAEPPPAPEPEPEPQEPAGIYPCPCCGYLTLPVPREEALAYICPVCFWENDVFDPGEDDPSDENRGMTLRQGRENYRRWGAVRRDLARHARKPRQEEIPDQQT